MPINDSDIELIRDFIEIVINMFKKIDEKVGDNLQRAEINERYQIEILEVKIESPKFRTQLIAGKRIGQLEIDQ